MSGPELLQAAAGRLRSRVGGFVPGVRAVFRGHDLHADLADMDWMALYVFGITGKRYTPAQIELMHAIWTYTSFPDARLWNNREAGLAGSTRSTGALGLSAALAVSEAGIYGSGVLTKSIDFFLRARARLDTGDALADCVAQELEHMRGVPGYGRPLTSVDERMPPMMRLLRKLGFDQMPYIRLALQVQDLTLMKRHRLKLNYGGMSAALAADLGMSQREYTLFLFPCFLAGMVPCYIEASDKPAGTLFPTPCADVAYEGQGPRRWADRPR
ncbi:MAG: citryl-CoA lyase [Burkholderiales bacterium]|nr:citryl-CoA lyase [Burkholderiales bacterium]